MVSRRFNRRIEAPVERHQLGRLSDGNRSDAVGIGVVRREDRGGTGAVAGGQPPHVGGHHVCMLTDDGKNVKVARAVRRGCHRSTVRWRLPSGRAWPMPEVGSNRAAVAAASLFSALGIDAATEYDEPQGRPRIISAGCPVDRTIEVARPLDS